MTKANSSSLRAQGSLEQYSPTELLDRLAQLGFTGRLSLVATPGQRRVVTLHLEDGEPVLAVGSSIARGLPEQDEAYLSRQAILEALCWEQGQFSLAEGSPGAVSPKHRLTLGSAQNLIQATIDRQKLWDAHVAQLPAPIDKVTVTKINDEAQHSNSVDQAVLAATSATPVGICEVARRTRHDAHLVLQSIVELAAVSSLSLSCPEAEESLFNNGIEGMIVRLLDLLQPGRAHKQTLKITVLSWDSATLFRAVDTLFGRHREPPSAVDDSPRYQVISETMKLKKDVQLEVLAFRSDAFEPDFCAPLVQDCHVFLLFSDLEAHHSLDDEAPLVDRINRVREMFSGASLAGRVTVGASAETDPGCDVLLPELGRYYGWAAVQTPGFLPNLLSEVIGRLE